VRQQIAHPRAGLAVTRKPEGRFRDRQHRLSHRLGHPLALADRVGNLRALVLREPRLVVERLELRGTAGLVEKDDALRRRREVRQTDQSARLRIASFGGGHQLRAEQRGERANPDTLGAGAEELPARQLKFEGVGDAHDRIRCPPEGGHYCLLMVSSRLKITLATVV
jgi:hypothetical protein